jgi:hypothetical protein
VNGLDRAELIATYAMQFEGLLTTISRAA